MKKIFCILFLSTVLNSIFAIGAGVQIGGIPSFPINQDKFYYGTNANITGTIKFMRIPMALGAGLEAGNNVEISTFGISAFADYFFIDKQIKNTWNFYGGLGLSGRFLFDFDNNFFAGANLRLVTGMNYLVYDNYLELYVQDAISPGFIKSLTNDNFIFNVNVPIEAGIRFHF